MSERELDTSKTSVVILCGGGINPGWEKFGAKDGRRALAEVDGKPMWQRVRDAFVAAGFVDIVIVVDWLPCGWTTSAGWRLVTGGGSFGENLRIGIEAAKYDDFILSTCDIVCISPDDIRQFAILSGSIPGLAIGVSVIDMAESDKDPRFYGIPRHSARFSDGRFTLGNMFRMNKKVVFEHVGDMSALYDIRKSMARLALRLGASFLWRLIQAQTYNPEALSITMLEDRGSRIMKMPIRAILSAPPIGADFDKPKHLEQLIANCF